MKFKSYAGRDLAEIVPQIREELGPDAVILKQRTTKSGGVGGFFQQTGIEVLAADRNPSEAAEQEAQHAVSGPPLAAHPSAPAPVAASAPQQSGAEHPEQSGDGEQESSDELLRRAFFETLSQTMTPQEPAAEPQSAPVAVAEREAEADDANALAPQTGYTQPLPRRSWRPAATAAAVSEAAVEARASELAAPSAEPALRVVAHAAAPAVEQPQLDEEQADLALELERAGVTSAVAQRLIRDTVTHVKPFSDQPLRALLRARIAQTIHVEQGWEADGAARRVAVVGTSGTGKTSSVARLAAGLADGGLRVGIIAIHVGGHDDHPLASRLGAAADADRLLAYSAGTDLIRVATPEEATRAVARLVGRDAILVDSPGLGLGEDDRSGAVRQILAAIAPHETHLVLPLGMADREADAALARFSRLGADRLLVTKIDEARFAGPLLDMAERTALPLSYLGTGPRVPGDLEPADGARIAARILPV